MKMTIGKPVLFALLAACCLLGACKKNDDAANPAGSDYAAPLLPESSGWQRIGYVNNTGTYVDQLQPAQMTAYDLQMTPSLNSIQLVYSEDKLEPFNQTAQYYKASFFIGKPADSVYRTLLKQPFSFAAGPPDELTHRILFQPGTFNVYDLLFYHYASRPHYDFMLHDEYGNLVTSQGPFIDATQRMKILANGDLIAGDVNGGGICELDYYHNGTRTWDYVNQSSGDTQFAIAYTPFKLADGSVLAWRMWSKAGKSYLSIADFNYTAAYPTPPYTTRFAEEHPEYAPSGLKPGTLYTPVFAGKASVAAYTTSGNTVTVVLAYTDNTTGATTLSAFKWTEGTTAFQKIYSGVPIAATTAQMAALHGAEAGCTPEGIFYTLVRSTDGYYQLSLTDAGGERSLGRVTTGASVRQAVTMSCLRYLNGAYYAVATPFFSGKDYEGQHLDVVKLTP